MSETVDVRTVGWNTDCEYQVRVDDSYEDDSGQTIPDYKWESRLKCQMVTVNAKLDYCKTCGKNLLYP
jgi:hypothetical protein